MAPQIRALARGLDVLVATPGRLVDHLDSRVAHLGKTEFFVLDEVDQMLDLGFAKSIRRIVGTLPKQRQNLFFSATMPTEIAKLAGDLLNDPVQVSVTPAAKTARPRQPAGALRRDPSQARRAGRSPRRSRDGAHPRLHPHQARRRQGDPASRGAPASPPSPFTATRASPSASARSRPSRPGACARSSRPTSPPAASTSTASPMSSISICPRSPKPMCTGSGAPRARAPRASPFRSATAPSATFCATSKG